MTIKYIRNIILMSAFGAVFTGCDTTEDAYHLGDLGDIRISTVPTSQLRLAADGKPMDIEVTSNVYWNVENFGNRFTVQASSDKGNGKISVSGPVNVNATQTPSETVLITARDFDKEIRIEVLQARLQFDMPEREYPVAPQEGAEVSLRFNSSIDWRLVARNGELDWLYFNPGSDGAGEWDEIEVEALWTPNYTTSPRYLELQLRPADESLLEFITVPSSFTLTQEAGTLPENVRILITGEPTFTECPLSVSYGSKAPVEEVGVMVMSNGTQYRHPAPVPEGGFPLDGSVDFVLNGLEEGMRYEVRPYVVSRVGETVGEMVETFVTGSSVVYNGARIVDVEVIPFQRMVAASITVESDCELTWGGIAIYYPSNPDYQAVKYSKPLSGMSQTFVHESVEWMEQNTEYLLEPFVKYYHLEMNIEIEVKGEKIPFKTLYRIPE